MQTTIGSHGLALVSTQDFSVRMRKHWSETLNMSIPPPLMAAHRLMAEEFQRLTINNATVEGGSASVVLPLPTGSGKTQGTCLYASMQADLNVHVSEKTKPVGVVIITRLIEDADDIAKQINELSGRVVAVAHHTKSKADAVDVFNSDVLVICHQAFLNAARGWGVQDPGRWRRLSQWRGGDRHLFIIDEALANVVESNKTTAPNLTTVLMGIPQELRQRFPGAITTLELTKRWLVAKETSHADASPQLLWGGGSERVPCELRLLREALQDVDFDASLFKEEASTVVAEILQDVEAMFASFAYYFKSGDQHSINGATYLLPPGLPGAVILDATAKNDVLYQLLDTRVHVATIPPNVRDYSNVTIHVALTSSGLGKSVSDDTKHLRLPRLAKCLSEQISPERSVFLCVHKHSEALAETFSTDRLKLKVGHWGAIDGKNSWKDCDVAVIFGLYYMDQRRAINNLFATHGPQDTVWLRANTHKQQVNLVNVIMQRHLSTSIVQAINRICCRRVIDEEGRCPVSDVYILLPKNWQGDAILDDIQVNMPGIKVVPWDFEPDGPKVYAPRNGSAHAAIISLMRGREPGLTPFPFIQGQLSLSPKQIGRVKAQLLNGGSNIAKALREIGVSYLVTGVGRGSKSYLVKA
jgi:hypothetical protein